jgi:hypothetical protein
MSTTDAAIVAADELAGYARLMTEGAGLRDLDLDAFADGVLAHRTGIQWHENPHGPDAMTRRRLSWAMGWNERALQTRS